VVVTNQRGTALGLMTETDLDAVGAILAIFSSASMPH
jgi:histidinol phosphatase-like enzyme